MKRSATASFLVMALILDLMNVAMVEAEEPPLGIPGMVEGTGSFLALYQHFLDAIDAADKLGCDRVCPSMWSIGWPINPPIGG
jgi:hypothetical protein